MLVKLSEGQYFGQILQSREYDFFKCTLTEYFPQTSIEKHYHENDYLSLLVKGKYVEQDNAADSMLEAGNIIFRPSLYSHSNIFLANGGTCFNIEFKNNWKDIIESDLHLPCKKNIYQPWAVHIINRLFYEFIQKEKEYLLEELMINWLFEINKKAASISSLTWIEKVKQILEIEADVHHTIGSISERVFVHPIYLAGAFKRKTGYTIGEWQRRIKLRRSTLLLINTKLTIDQIAISTGFNDSSHFIRSFKNVYKISPARFRNGIKS